MSVDGVWNYDWAEGRLRSDALHGVVAEVRADGADSARCDATGQIVYRLLVRRGPILHNQPQLAAIVIQSLIDIYLVGAYC